jgi:hypothetical protein
LKKGASAPFFMPPRADRRSSGQVSGPERIETIFKQRARGEA